ncbi:outer membrane beta-barrel protein [Prevotellamassilia timonensis]|uniref:outer membrane beta-barrel protein n=1 Tax=Prevotellamassilia timonensis TaxID=1852370 RepID=UPI0023F0F15B|nr:outer membrane beta-barrel protein [Prevotellamassilia timonensis]MDD7439228.1 outer membrane beta-barrel protein [Prevotellamassilia timonensis]
MKRLLFILFALQSIASYGQMFSITVKDAATKISLQGASVTILDKDSAFVDSCQMITINMGDRKKYFYASQIEGSSPYYYIQCEKKGYLSQLVKVDAADDINPEPIMLKRAPRTLHEATVTATKVMMVMKGDTIVYNADAFELAEGSMLDQLISRLPGVKLNAGGVITVNGNRVSNLLIDGKDFFNGDANVALENLPAYMVKNVKSYQKAPDNAYLTRKDNKPHADDPWVIDVTLKKEYHQGWIANAEAGGGTQNKYLGRVFGTYFSDRARVGFYGNANNTNSNQRAGTDGKWENEDAMMGENTLQKGGLFASFYGGKDSERPIRFITTLEASHNKDVNESRGNSVNFYESGNTYGKVNSLYNSKNYNLNWIGALSIPTSFAYIHLDQYFYYTSSSTNSQQQSVLSRYILPDEWTNMTEGLVNSYTDLSQSKASNLSYAALLDATVKLPHDKEFSVNFAVNTRTSTDKTNSLYNLITQGVEPTTDFRNRYNHNKQQNLQLLGSIDYPLIEIKKSHGKISHNISTNYHIEHQNQQGNRNFYRLDRLGGDWALPDRKLLGQGPSTTDSLALATDWGNTNHTMTRQTMHNVGLRYSFEKDDLYFHAALPMAFTRNAIDDLRMKDQQRHIVKHYQWLQPSFSLSFKNIKMSGSIAHTAPQMSLLLDVTDDSNPLFITKGNTTLKPANIYNATLGYTLNKTKHAQNLNAEWGYSAQQNAVGQARYYDAETGVTTSMAQNINGNWQTHVTVGYACSLDKKQKWTFDVSATETFQNSVDFQQTSLMPTSAKSEVKNWFMQGNVALAYHCKLFNAVLKSAVDWQHATSKLTGFQTINSINHLYTFTNQWSLPWNMVIDTDLTYYVRSGYADHSMNSHEWIWNMAVAKRMLKSKALSLKLSGHDILAQRRSIVRTLNAQGRTETWHNVVPRYFMLSLVYHFSKSPRKE